MPPMSPRTQQLQMGAGAGADQATDLFEHGFSEMAYNVLLSKLPDIVGDVVTFKILDSDIDAGSAVGAFVLLRNDQPMYVPVVLSDNNIKPIELVYHKALNIFLPLTKGWLEEIDKTALGALGKGIKTPETLYSDVDIRNIVVPPITGRFSYAAWEPIILADVRKVINRDALEKNAAEPAVVLVDFLNKAPNFVKKAFVRVLEKNPKLLKHAASVYGVNALTEALRPHQEKVAAKQLYGGGLWIADKDTTPTDYQRIFGDQAAEAYIGVRRKGYAAKDQRFQHNLALQEQPYESLVEPQQPGVYCLYSSEHGDEPAFVMPHPIDITARNEDRSRYARRPPVPGHNPLVDNSYYDPEPEWNRMYEANRVYPDGRPDEADYVLPRLKPKYLAVLKNGDYLMCDSLVGRASVADEIDGSTLHKRLFETLAGEPRQGLGFFVRARGTTFQATVPVRIKSITNTEGTRRIKIEAEIGYSDGDTVLITDNTNPFNAISMPKDSPIVYLPPDFIWVPLKERRKPGDFFTSALDLQACLSNGLASVGAKKVAIKNAHAGQVSIDGSAGVDRITAIKKLAFNYGLRVDDADALVKRASEERVVRFWVATPMQLGSLQVKLGGDDDKSKDKDKGGDKKKSSSPPKKSSPPGGGGAPDMGGGDPSMGGEDDLGAQAAMAAMAPPAPPPPSPLEMAMMEFQQHIDNEVQKLHEKSLLLASLANRESQIAGGAPPMPATQSMAMGAPPAPGMSAGTPMDAMEGGPPPGVGAAPMPGEMSAMGMGGAPGMGGGMGMPPGGADQAMMGGPGAMGGDPGMGGMMMPAAPGGALPMSDQMGGMGGAPGGAPPGMGGAPGMGGPPGMGGAPGMGGMGGAPGGPPGMPAPGMGGDPMQQGQPMQPSMAMMGPDGPSAQGLSQEVNPQFLQQAAMLQSHDIFDAAAVSSLAQSPAVKELTAQYLPNLEKALDNLGRVLLTLWMQETTLKQDIGEATFSDLEDNLRNTFKSMGDLVLKLSQGSHAMPGQFENAAP